MQMNKDSTARRALAIAALIGLLALAACHRQDDPAAPAPRAGGAPRKHVAAGEPSAEAAVADANRKMAAGVPVGASTAPVEVRFDLASVPVAGQSFDVSVAVLPAAPAPVLRIEFRGGPGLSIVKPEAPVSIEKVQAGTLESLTVTATAATAGTRVLGVTVTLELPTGTESRNFAFPVVVGPAGPTGPTKSPPQP